MNFEKLLLKIVHVIIYDDIIKLQDFDFDNIFYWMKNHTKMFWFTIFHTKL